MAQVRRTPRVAKVMPGANTDLISLNFVSMPPEKRMIHIAKVLSASAVLVLMAMPPGSPNSPPIPCGPKSIPTIRNSSKAGTP